MIPHAKWVLQKNMVMFSYSYNEMNASKIFYSLKLLSWNSSLLTNKSWKHKVTSYFYQEKTWKQSKIQPSWNSVHEICLNFSKQLCFKLASKWFFAFGDNFEISKIFLWYRCFVRTKHLLNNIILEKDQANKTR